MSAVKFQQQELKWLNDRRWHESKKLAEKARMKEIEKTLKRHPQVVREYLTALINHQAFAKLAIVAAECGLFSPESIHLLRTKHLELSELMRDLETKISGN